MRRLLTAAVLIAAIVLAGHTRRFTVAADAQTELEVLFADDWAFTLEENPLFATRVGAREYNDRLSSATLEAYERRLRMERRFLERLLAIDRSGLSPADRTNYDLFERAKRTAIAELEFRSYLMPITSRSGFYVSFADLPNNVPLNTVEDYENYVSRLEAFATWTDEHIELMRTGTAEGYTAPAVALLGYEKSIVPHIVEDPTESLLYEPFEQFPESIPEGDRARLAEAGRMAISGSVVPAYRTFLVFMREEYVPAAREEIAASALPDGRAFYEFRIRRFTTLDLTPQQVHEIGLAEVARIRAEMETIIERVGFDGGFAEFVEFLRTEPEFYAKTPEELMREAALVLKRMDGQLPVLFSVLPRMPYGIRSVPDFIAPKTSTAYYSPPAGDGTRAGFYYINTYDLPSRPLYEIEALSLHEAVPGHHLQIALQQELEGLPAFRRFSGFTAFVEGWALYAERLGLEVGFYTDPYSDFGRLTYEMWRACRLVVDPGMHYLGWSRQQAIDFMAENTALSLHNITTEVDRYITWPAQAVAYKTGELKIRELRGRAEERLGDRFDVREFHEVVLGEGAVPLDVLEANVDTYIEATLGAPGSGSRSGS
jgi:uncharacterized protein (DUF885 family)